MLFRIALGIDALAAVVALYFFLSGLARGSVSSFNIGIWAALLGALALVLGGSLALRRAGHSGWGVALLGLIAIPALLYGLFIVLVIVLQPRWN
jgi:hypothetical protein